MKFQHLTISQESQLKDESDVFISKTSDRFQPSKASSVENVFDLIKLGAKNNEKKSCIGYRDIIEVIKEDKVITNKDGSTTKKQWNYFKKTSFNWINYGDYLVTIENLASGLRNLGIKSNCDKILMFAPTSHYWTSFTYACMKENITIVTIYDTLGEEGVKHAIEECECSMVFVDDTRLSIISSAISSIDHVKHIVYFGSKDTTNHEFKGVRLLNYDDLLNDGKNPLTKSSAKADKEATACIMYTSGSTGKPKGVIMKHKNLIQTVYNVYSMLNQILNEADIFPNFLPLSHILALQLDIYCMFNGIKIGYCNPTTLLDSSVRGCKGDFNELKPTSLVAVPRIYEGILKQIQEETQKSTTTKIIFNGALWAKSWMVWLGLDTWFLDSLIFDKIKSKFGGNLRWMLSGGAPISKVTSDSISHIIAPISQAYGLTECSGAITIAKPNLPNNGSAGLVVPNIEIKLVDYPEAGYFHNNAPSQGELWVKGDSVVSGYYNNQTATNDVFTKDGWFKTGDIVQLNEDETITVIDRRKNIVKLANGEYIAIEKIESIYTSSFLLESFCIFVDSLKNNPIAVAVPNFSAVKSLAKANGLQIPGELSDISKDAKLCDLVYKEVIKGAKSGGLKGSELIMALYLCPEKWTTDNGTLTPTNKIDRRKIEILFKEEIRKLYALL